MCMDHSVVCKCGRRDASFNFKNEVMPPEAINTLHCPVCSSDVSFNEKAMIRDNGWIIHYDMEVAGLYSNRLPCTEKERLSPGLLFDEGYITWRGVYPGDHIDSLKEKEELATLAKISPNKYFDEMRSWAIDRMTRLKNEGWRKASDG